MHNRLGAILGVFIVIASGAWTQESATPHDFLRQTTSPARAEVLVLGVYHMANPGRDVFNTQADDVLTPKRQAEMSQVTAVLKKFNPTKIAVERDPGDKRLSKDYSDYLAGKHELTRNEIEQIGFRFARELGHKAVYGVDADGEFPYPRVVKYAKATGRSKEFEEIEREIGSMVKPRMHISALTQSLRRCYI